ncbi:MAG: 3TM-type holin [Terriglobia bacterium]
MSILGTLFGAANPAGGVAGLVTDVLDHIKMTPEQKAQLQLALDQNQIELAKLDEQYDQQITASVNASIQAEAKSGHFLQWAWRPLFGLTGAAVLAINYVLIPLFGGHFGLRPIEMPTSAWDTILAVVGVSAASRGYEKIVRAQGSQS